MLKRCLRIESGISVFSFKFHPLDEAKPAHCISYAPSSQKVLFLCKKMQTIWKDTKEVHSSEYLPYKWISNLPSLCVFQIDYKSLKKAFYSCVFLASSKLLNNNQCLKKCLLDESVNQKVWRIVGLEFRWYIWGSTLLFKMWSLDQPHQHLLGTG